MDIILSLTVIAVSVYLLAIITEEFFVVSLDEVSKRLKLPSDVAGASLMAMGSSAPELFIAFIALYRGGDHSDVGIGTIVGSAVFNILVITGASAVVAGKLIIKRGAVERDIIFYLGSIAILLYVFRDGEIVLFEALIMLVAYFTYLLILWYWSRTNPEDVEDVIGGKHIPKQGTSLFARISNMIEMAFSYVARDPEKNYVWALFVSILAIAALSYALVESAVVLSHALSLPPVLVSLTLLAAGTSTPDLLASVDVARDGRGTMAVANAVGSNIFDVLFGLGLPWAFTIVFINAGETIHVGTDGLMESMFLLSATTIILYILLNTGRILTRREGYALLGTYALYFVYVVITTS